MIYYVEFLFVHTDRWLFVFQVVTLFLCLSFLIFYRDRPQYHNWVNGIELNKIVAGKVQVSIVSVHSSWSRLAADSDWLIDVIWNGC